VQLGIYTFGDIVPAPDTGRKLTHGERMEELLAMAQLVEEFGLDIFAVGEHHTPNFIASSPATILAAVGTITHRIQLSSAVTLLSTADPVRTFQEFATADLVSKGRIELIFGRGAFTEQFPLFGYDLADYDALFVEKLELFRQLNETPRVSWNGKFRSPLIDVEVAPRPLQTTMPVWIGAGSPQSVARAARLGLPLALPLLGRTIEDYGHLADIYREAWVRSGRKEQDVRIAAFSHMHIANTSASARDGFYPHYDAMFARLSGRGGLPRAAFDQMSAPDGVMMLGDAQEVLDRLMRLNEAVGLNRYLGQTDMGGQPYGRIARSIELFATKVAPELR